MWQLAQVKISKSCMTMRTMDLELTFSNNILRSRICKKKSEAVSVKTPVRM